MDNTQKIAAGELRAFIERFERLDGEKQAIADDQKQLVSELKGRGYDVKAFRAIIKARKKEAHERAEEEAMIELYMEALGMQ